MIKTNIKIVPYNPVYHQALVEIWRNGVRKTHTFLSDEAFYFYHEVVDKQALTSVKVCVALSLESHLNYPSGKVLGFAGWTGEMIEMLFVAPEVHGQGVGRQLLDYLTKTQGCKRVDVNEQNPQARAFYCKYGFVETGRSPLDGNGYEYPIIHAEFREKL